MKRKEMIQLLVAVVILVAAGSFIFLQLSPPKKGATASAPTIEKITPVSPNYDSSATTTITDTTKIHDFYQAPDLSHLGNSAPFGS